MNNRWFWYNEVADKWSLTADPGTLRITGTNNDMWLSCTNPRNLLLQTSPADDYTVETSLLITPTHDFQQGGLLIFQDLNNYIKLDVVWNDTDQGGLSVELIYENGGAVPTSPKWPWKNITQSYPAYLKIVKTGNLYTGLYSPDGQQWITVGAVTASRLTNTTVGLFALANNCQGNTANIAVDFDYFRAVGVEKHTIFLPAVRR